MILSDFVLFGCVLLSCLFLLGNSGLELFGMNASFYGFCFNSHCLGSHRSKGLFWRV